MTNSDAIHQLNAALERLASALESGKPDAVLDAEAPLATAIGLLSNLDRISLARDPRTPAALLDLRLSVARCRAMGRAAADLSGVLLGQTSYGPAGARPALPGRASTVASRT